MMITWKGSPNYIKRKSAVKKIVIHWFGTGTLESANARFQQANAAVPASAHYGVSKGRVWQWVDEKNAAFQAGNLAVNHESIGIEHDALLGGHSLSSVDYQLSGELVREIAARHNIPLDRQHIIGHREVKNTQCPGTIDIDKIINIAKKSMTNAKIVQREGTKEVGIYLPMLTEAALLSAGRNFGLDIPENHGAVDWERLKKDGIVKY